MSFQNLAFKILIKAGLSASNEDVKHFHERYLDHIGNKKNLKLLSLRFN
jgi:hypothetical protein